MINMKGGVAWVFIEEGSWNHGRHGRHGKMRVDEVSEDLRKCKMINVKC